MIKEIVQFFLSGKKYAVELQSMQGIENYSPMTNVMDSGAKMKGVVTIRGELIPVINIGVCLSIQPSPVTQNTKYVLLRTLYGTMAIVADDVGDISRLSEDEVRECPSIVQAEGTGYVNFVARDGKSLVLVINPDNLLTKEEWEGIRSSMEEIGKKNEDE